MKDKEKIDGLTEILKVIKSLPPSIKSVPYQLCPKCNGHGSVERLSHSTTGIGVIPCDVCNGSKIIPQHIVS